MDNIPNINLGTKYHNQVDTVVSELPSEGINEQPHQQLIHTTETAICDQAIDASQAPGVINARYVRTLMTPSGMKPVILLTDEEIDLDVFHDYLPGCALPEQGHVWSDRKTSIALSSAPSISDKPSFSLRTLYFRNPYAFYNSHVICRLICKPALTQSQSFWVSRSSAALTINNSRHLNEIGFNWVPSKANEIFVLMPWFNNHLVSTTVAAQDDSFGYLNVFKITDVVSATGNEIPLKIDYYFAPYKMYTYVPNPILNAPGTVYSGTLTCTGSNKSGTGTVPLGTLNFPGTTWVSVNRFALSGTGAQTAYSAQLKLGGSGFTTLLCGNKNGSVSGGAIEATAGNSALSMLTIAGDTITITNDIIIMWYNTTNIPPTWVVLFAEQMGEISMDTDDGYEDMDTDSTLTQVSNKIFDDDDMDTTPLLPKTNDKILQTKEIPKVLSTKDYSEIFNYDYLPDNIIINDKIKNHVSCVQNGFHLRGIHPHFTTSVISQNPSIVSCKLTIGSKLIFNTFAENKIQGKNNGFDRIYWHYVFQPKVECGTEQIFEYSHNPKSSCPALTYGKMFDHSPRENHHDMFINTLVISSTNKYTPFNVTLNVGTVAASYPYVNTREYARHYIKSRMPVIIIRSNKTPFSNVLFRVVQGTFTDYSAVMQLPGLEWDPSLTDLTFQPYWTYQDPGSLEISVPLTIVCLSGQIDTAGMQLVVFFNTSTLDYHHKIDYLPYPPPATSLNSLRRELGICQRCSTSPCVCIEVGVEQSGTISTVSESLEQKTPEERSTSKLEGVQMETNRSHDSLEMKKVQIEKDFHFVGSLTQTATAILKFIAIPISHVNFGKMEVTTAKRYQWWQGEPTYKISTACSSTVANIFYAAQVPEDFDFTNAKAIDALRMYPRTESVFWNQSVELPIKWYNTVPKLPVEYNTVAPFTAQLGYLVIVFPIATGATFTGGDANIKITISCDTSNIGYSRPSNNFPDYDYPGLQSTSYSGNQ